LARNLKRLAGTRNDSIRIADRRRAVWRSGFPGPRHRGLIALGPRHSNRIAFSGRAAKALADFLFARNEDTARRQFQVGVKCAIAIPCGFVLPVRPGRRTLSKVGLARSDEPGRLYKRPWLAATSLYGIRTGGTHHPAVPARNMLAKIPTFVLSVLALLTAHSRREDNLEEADSGMRR
jgi:hypothetical protein